jgi:hypothetical protein
MQSVVLVALPPNRIAADTGPGEYDLGELRRCKQSQGRVILENGYPDRF